MFCDLVGSTALSARLDPEDMREVIRSYQDACSGAVARYDGFVAKFMGDGVLAYFGFPRAHEEDAERAVRAALDIAAVAGKLETPARQALKVRIGIATGIVVVGDLVGTGSAQEQAVIGDTPNLAARLQALAEPGSVLVAEATRRLLGRAFELKALGLQTLKGFDAAIPAWAVVREAENVSRFEASRSHGMTPFVGREREIALLLDRWRHATEGEGQIALLSGEAGIGKSRMLATLRERIGDAPHVTTRYQCSPHHVNDAFYPIVSQMRYAAGFGGGESAAARLDKLDALMARSAVESKEAAALLAALLSIPFEGRYPALEMAPSEQKERTIGALVALFEGLTKAAPHLALLEDAHWIDPTSLDVFNRVVDRLPDWRALLVVTFRPEFAAPWIGRANVELLSLSRFGRRQALAMIDRVAGGKPLPAEVLDQIVGKTDGVPLFVEELTKTVLESGLLREEDGSYALAAALTPLAIPATLQDSLMARLDRLAPVKETAQIAAAIGREFPYRLLEAVSPIQGPPLQGRPRPAHGGGVDPRPRRASGGDLRLQACARPGHRLRHASEEPPAATAPANRRSRPRSFSRTGGPGTGSDRPSFHAGGAAGDRRGMVGSSRSTGDGPFREFRSRSKLHQRLGVDGRFAEIRVPRQAGAIVSPRARTGVARDAWIPFDRSRAQLRSRLRTRGDPRRPRGRVHQRARPMELLLRPRRSRPRSGAGRAIARPRDGRPKPGKARPRV